MMSFIAYCSLSHRYKSWTSSSHDSAHRAESEKCSVCNRKTMIARAIRMNYSYHATRHIRAMSLTIRQQSVNAQLLNESYKKSKIAMKN